MTPEDFLKDRSSNMQDQLNDYDLFVAQIFNNYDFVKNYYNGIEVKMTVSFFIENYIHLLKLRNEESEKAHKDYYEVIENQYLDGIQVRLNNVVSVIVALLSRPGENATHDEIDQLKCDVLDFTEKMLDSYVGN